MNSQENNLRAIRRGVTKSAKVQAHVRFRPTDIGLKHLVGRGKAGLFAIERNSREEKLRLVS